MLLQALKSVHLELLVLLFICWNTASIAQQNNLVWYFSSKEKSEVQQIGTILKSLKEKKTNIPFFTDVLFLNSLQSNEAEEFELRKQLDRFAESGTFFQDNSSSVNETLLKKLLGFNYFLRVELQTNPSFLEKEFRFSLYKAIPGDTLSDKKAALAEIDLQSLLIKDSKIVPEMSTVQVFRKLGNTIKQLFPFLNELPVAKIRVNGKEKSIHYNTEPRAIELSGEYSDDKDGGRKGLAYQWRQIAINGQVDVPVRKSITLKHSQKKGTYVLPDTGTYKIGLIVNDGIGASVEDTVTIINFIAPKIELSKRSLRKRPKISLFQFLRKKHWSKKIKDEFQVNINSEVPLSYELNSFVVGGKAFRSIQMSQEQIDNKEYKVKFSGKLRQEEGYVVGYYGKTGDIYTDTSYYFLRHSKLQFGRISMGVEPFVGPAILCVEPLKDRIWAVAPTAIMGSIYLMHDRGVSFSFEAGVLIFWNEQVANRLADGTGLGKVALKITTDLPKLAPYFALQAIGGIVTNEQGEKINRLHYGCILGTGLLNNRLDVDMLNMYYNFEDRCFTLSGGIRVNLNTTGF